ncbi:hypothetical protein SELMODRAFT_403040 [Selaginella moellendorffii]|uniref:Uncharacterized protein n=1 Tax=Selaginella moellendorffii TaxID=88036 RepID=D8QNV3_SELML|nr:hypothetical protein SELMODRAFT_403040 [Selaginella moellendorffii]
MAVSLVSLLRTHIPSPGFTGSTPLCDSFIGEQDPHPLPEPQTAKRHSARLYGSLVIPVQELSAEYQKRFQVGGGLHLSNREAAVVMYGNADGSISQPPNFRMVKPTRYFLEWLAIYTTNVSTPSGMSREEDVFQVSDHVVFDMNSPPQDAGSPTFFEALFLMHLMFQESSLPLPQQNLDQPFPRRKRINYSSAGPNTVNALSRIYKEQAADLSSEDIVTLQLSDLKLSSWCRIHSGEQVSVFWGRFKNEKAVFKSVDVCKAPDKLPKMVREVWVMARLKSLQGDIIPRLYASGFLDGGIWLTIMQDIGRTSIDKNYEELYKDSQQSLP